jgi:hypothetical protein
VIQVVIIYAISILSFVIGWWFASMCWANSRADLDTEVSELRARLWNLTRDEEHA